MNSKEERYLDDKINLIRAVVTGTLMGAYMFGMQDGKRSMGDKVYDATNTAMALIAKDVRQVYKHGKRQSKPARL